jgi:hypothetical protein
MKRLATLWLSMMAVVVGLFAASVLSAGGASAQTSTTTCYPACTSATSVAPPVSTSYSTTPPASTFVAPAGSSGTAEPVVATASSASTGTLAFTGADVTGTIIVAVLLIGGGVVVLRLGRRRRA